MAGAGAGPAAPPGDRLLIPVLSAANFVIGMGAFMVIGMLVPVADDLGLTTAGAGWIMTIYALSYAVLSPLAVAATGRIGRRRVLTAGMATFGLASLLALLAPTAEVLLAARGLAALGAGLTTPVAAAVVAATSPPERRARALAAVFFGLTLAQVLGVPAGGWLAYTFGWRSAFGVVAALALPCAWLIWRRVPAGLRLAPVGLSDLGAVLRDIRPMSAVLFTTTFLGAIYVVFTYFAALLEARMGYGRDGVTLVLLVFGLGAVVGNLVGGALSDRIGAYRTLMVLAVAQVGLLLPFSALPMPDAALLALVFVWSVFGWSFAAPQQLRVIGIAPERASVLLALNAAAIYVGAAVGAAIGGAVIGLAGLDALGVAAALAALVALGNLVLSRRLNGGRA
ncbi:MFS transporter [Roseicyclus persicicus]|uniref:MFS transporter n=1 Tax=Roseicyclus persicicus TaxID=2650661 RepID=A0A7X6GZN5_9RHOB|nr:MFS transporter [Roseibacterium persicicum]